MSNYTTQLRFICEELAGYNESQDYVSIDEVIDRAIPKIFDFEFPIYDNAYRNVLCKKIIMNYYTHEIGSETVALWKLRLRNKLEIIMPYYNQLYETAKIKIDPLSNMDYSRNYKREHDGTDTGENNDWNLFQDTPQGGIDGVEDENYLTTATHNKGTLTTTYDTTETYVESLKGLNGTYTQTRLLMDYRDTLFNIDKMIIDELSDLFFMLW